MEITTIELLIHDFCHQLVRKMSYAVFSEETYPVYTTKVAWQNSLREKLRTSSPGKVSWVCTDVPEAAVPVFKHREQGSTFYTLCPTREDLLKKVMTTENPTHILLEFENKLSPEDYQLIEFLSQGFVPREFSSLSPFKAIRFPPLRVIVFSKQLPDLDKLPLECWQLFTVKDLKLYQHLNVQAC